MFPGKDRGEPLKKHERYNLRARARDAIGIVADARLHDLAWGV